MKEYSADQVSIVIAGIPITGGFADGEFLKIEKDSDAYSDVVGSDGSVTRSRTNDRRATATLMLMQSSSDNDLLSALALRDRITPGGAGVGAFFVRDRLGTALYKADECWVAKTPDATFDRDAKSREWKIRIAELDDFTGGNF